LYVTVVRLVDLAEPVSPEQAADLFGQNASRYLDVPGLLFKAYLRAADGTMTGGVYWWADRASAEAKFNDGWRQGLTEKYGRAPIVEWFDAPVVVDPRSGEVITEPPSP